MNEILSKIKIGKWNLANLKIGKFDINKLDFNKFAGDNKKLVVLVILVIGFIYADFSFILTKQLNNINSAGSQIVKIKDDLDRLDNDLNRMERLKGKQTDDKDSALESKRLISNEEVVALLQDISTIAKDNGVEISQMQPSKEIKKAASKRTDRENKQQTNAELPSVHINLSINSSYHDFGKFINDLENAPVFMSVRSMRIIPSEKGEYNREKIDLVLTTYVKD